MFFYFFSFGLIGYARKHCSFSLGFSLYFARKAQGKTQAELAQSASLSIPTVRLLETGRGNLLSWFNCLSVLSLVVLGHGLPEGKSIG